MSNIRVMFFKKGYREPLFTAKEINERIIKEQKDLPTIDCGYEDLDTEKDATLLQIYMNADRIELRNGLYKVLGRRFKATSPRALWIEVELLETWERKVVRQKR
ncbi:MAG: hypothetical protein GX895_10380 [Clostridiales bacterium]|uniref:hypothetical protein n=1 Tax=Clostridium sp. N3C TaxID=1776758 RepID=UPI00092DF2F4|nr:hypothetical protein [Clostridium sp. N3C]NLZ49168.1 hypothetical protein [Clostridiales bacterium]SCN24470.1 hypothetical protein N3C_1822 [Clostridium sp. N3C]